jgi:HlyD family secretion protein
MNTKLFRQVSLERLSSPEQLDQLLRVTSPRSWAGLTAIGLILTTSLVWGYKGTVVTTASGQGVIIRSGGVLNVVTHGDGLVMSVDVKVGERIKANQVVASVAQPVLEQKVRAMQQALEEMLRERQHALDIHRQSARLQIDALERQRTNAQRQITELEETAKLTQEQITAEEQLLAKGLITKQQSLVAKQKLIDTQDQIASLRAQIKQFEAQQFTADSQPQQDDADMRTRISNQQRDIAESQKQLSLAEKVVSPYPGQVIELKVSPGTSVTNGQPVLSIQPDEQTLELVAYLPSLQAKDTKAGMEAQVSPSNIKREEYGFIRGKVTYVSDYPATPAALMRNFENETLSAALTGAGPVTEIRVALDRNADTLSGFQWSTSKGPPIVLTSGTLCTVQVVTRTQKPVTLVLPFVKDKLGLN